MSSPAWTVTRAAAFVALAGMALAGAGCTDEAGPEGVARAFVDAHYVRIDRTGALALTSGLARSRVEQEIADTAGQPITTDTRKPTIRYRLVESRGSSSGRVTHLFEATIDVPGANPFEREFWVTTGEVEGGWRVVSFSERDPAAVAGGAGTSP